MRTTRTLILSLFAVFAFSAVASASASAFSLRWHVNGAEAAGQEVESAGGAFTLTAGGKAVNCTAVTDTGKVEAGGKDLAKTITFTGCTANAGACTAETAGAAKGTIVVTNIPTKLEEREGKLVDNFEQNVAKKEFVTLKFDEGGAECPNFPETKVKGTVAAEVTNLANKKEVSLTFPVGGLAGDTLNAFGVEASLEGTDTQNLKAGGELEGV